MRTGASGDGPGGEAGASVASSATSSTASSTRPAATAGAEPDGGDEARAQGRTSDGTSHGGGDAELGSARLVPLDPRVRHLWWAQGAVSVGLVTAIVAVVDVVLLAGPLGDPLPGPPGLLTALAALGGAVLVPLTTAVRYRRWRYAVRAEDLWIRSGLLVVRVSVIPFSRLQFVDTEQGPLDRAFGLAELVVHTAALGTSGRLPGLDVGEAETLRERLSRVEPGTAGI